MFFLIPIGYYANIYCTTTFGGELAPTETFCKKWDTAFALSIPCYECWSIRLSGTRRGGVCYRGANIPNQIAALVFLIGNGGSVFLLHVCSHLHEYLASYPRASRPNAASASHIFSSALGPANEVLSNPSSSISSESCT